MESALPGRRKSSRASPLLPLISPLLRSSPRRPAANKQNHQNTLRASLHLDSGQGHQEQLLKRPGKYRRVSL